MIEVSQSVSTSADRVFADGASPPRTSTSTENLPDTPVQLGEVVRSFQHNRMIRLIPDRIFIAQVSGQFRHCARSSTNSRSKMLPAVCTQPRSCWRRYRLHRELHRLLIHQGQAAVEEGLDLVLLTRLRVHRHEQSNSWHVRHGVWLLL